MSVPNAAIRLDVPSPDATTSITKVWLDLPFDPVEAGGGVSALLRSCSGASFMKLSIRLAGIWREIVTISDKGTPVTARSPKGKGKCQRLRDSTGSGVRRPSETMSRRTVLCSPVRRVPAVGCQWS